MASRLQAVAAIDAERDMLQVELDSNADIVINMIIIFMTPLHCMFLAGCGGN